MSEDVRPKRWKRWLKRALLAFLVLLIVALILHQVWNYRAGKALQRELDLIRAAGDPLTLDELWPPEIEPPSENAAYLYEAACDLLIACGFEETQQGFTDAPDDPRQWSDEEVAVVRQLIDRCEQPLQLISRAAQMERCRFDPDFTFPGTTSMKHLIGVRQTSRLLRWSALLRLHDGDIDGALGDCRTALAVSRALDDEPLVLCLLVRLALIGMGLKTTEDVVKNQQPARETCEAFLGDLAGVPASLREQLANAYKGERVVSRTFMAPFLGQWDILPLEMRVAAPHIPGGRISTFLMRPYLFSMEADYLVTLGPLIPFAEKPYPEARPELERLEAEADELKTKKFRSPGKVLALMMVPALVRAKVEETKAEGRIALAQVAFALKLHKAEHGEYPEALDALAPEFLEQVPLDPFTGGPLTYARDDEGFFVYSVGLNGVDDEGLTEFEQEGETIDPGTDDIAWWCTR